VHLVSRGHVRSRDKDGGHTIQSTVVETPMLYAKLMDLSVIERELSSAIEVYIAGISILHFFGFSDLDLDPMTFIYELIPYPLRHTGCASYVKAFESYRISGGKCVHLVTRGHFRSLFDPPLSKTSRHTQTTV